MLFRRGPPLPTAPGEEKRMPEQREPGRAGDQAPKRGRWSKGQSGNPAGRPAGARNQATLAREALLESHAEELIEKTIQVALAGEIPALKICLERLIPLRRQRPIHLALPELGAPGALGQTTLALIQAVAAGEVTPEEAESVARLLLAHSQVVAADDHEARLAALEAKLAPGPADKPQD
jgi:hypothetical protein